MNTATQEFAVPAIMDDAMSSLAMMTDDKQMDRMIRFAEIMATGKATIPIELRNVGDCLAITMQAMNWKMNPFAVAQKTHFISGKIGYEAQLVAAAINNSGAVRDTFHFEWYGPWEMVIGKFEIKRGDKGEYRVPGWKLADEDGIGIRVWATLKGETEPRELDLLLAQARTRNSTLWADDPRQQLAYLAQKRWARLYAPGVILGVYTADELEPQGAPERDITPGARQTRQSGAQVAQAAQDSTRNNSQSSAEQKARENLLGDLEIVAREQGTAAYAAAWSGLSPQQRVAVGTTDHNRLKKIAESIPGEVIGSTSDMQGAASE